jgi:hypothetical protein
MGQLGRAAASDDVLVWEHGRRHGIVGDGQAGNPSALVLDGKVIASNRVTTVKITAVAAGHNGAGAITVAGAVVGDTVMCVVNLSAPALASSSFEATVSVAGQVQQTSASDLSGSTFMFEVFPRS